MLPRDWFLTWYSLIAGRLTELLGSLKRDVCGVRRRGLRERCRRWEGRDHRELLGSFLRFRCIF